MLESIVAPWRPRPAAPAAPALSHSSCYNYNPAAAAGAAPKGGMRAVRCGLAEPSGKPAPMGQKTRYNDSLFDKAFMFLFARKMEAITGKSSTKEGYEGFVDVSRSVMQGRTPVEQQAIVRQVLLSMLPPGAPKTFQKLFPPTRSSAEINAAITVPFFQWLVGPCEQVEVEVNGLKQKSGVHISKCRYLENSGCVGMCVNMCKIPTQDFFTNEFGLPLTMTPSVTAQTKSSICPMLGLVEQT
ncbi:hypothetical protein O6H91_08G087800 [Diphasiastrum complanatum]|uniref:Uncharacterized protein n=1 Tax=Diphasiastrum complanatum TaxID=34168 RepID=A0ACC2CZV5_DIPCM|nr:hypothetical protein O6H91_08G087800 [Diphasiastrum complanatum]